MNGSKPFLNWTKKIYFGVCIHLNELVYSHTFLIKPLQLYYHPSFAFAILMIANTGKWYNP